MTSFTSQNWTTGQLVDPPAMNTFYNDIGTQLLNSYFPRQPCICSGLTYAQTDTTNTVAFDYGIVRFRNQSNALTLTAQATFAPVDPVTPTIACPVSPTQYYIVAQLQQSATPPNYIENSVVILSTAMTIAQIAAQINPLAFIPLYTITRTGSTYVIGVDAFCAYNYGRILEPEVVPLLPTGFYAYMAQNAPLIPAAGGTWAAVNGQTLASGDYPNLAALFSITIGQPIILPDWSGYTMAMASISHPAGEVAGSNTIILTQAQLAAHTHAQPAHNHTQNPHAHGITQNPHTHECVTANFSGDGPRFNGQSNNAPHMTLRTQGANANISINNATAINNAAQPAIASTGSNDPITILQPTAFVNNIYIFAN